MKISIGICIFFILNACVHDYELKPIDPYFIFHGNASKVWVINHLYKDKKDYAPLSIPYKSVLIFHANKNCYLNKINQLGEKNSEKAEYIVKGNPNTIKFGFKNKLLEYKIVSYSVNKIILRPIVAKEMNFTMELIPFPEY